MNSRSLSLSHTLSCLYSLSVCGALSLCLLWERWHSGWPESRTSFRICCGLFAAFRQLRPSVCKRRATRTVHLDPPEDSNYIVSAWVSATDSQSHSLSRSLVLSRSLRLSCRRSSNQSTWLVSLCVCVCADCVCITVSSRQLTVCVCVCVWDSVCMRVCPALRSLTFCTAATAAAKRKTWFNSRVIKFHLCYLCSLSSTLSCSHSTATTYFG